MAEVIQEEENNVITLNDLLHLDTSEPKKLNRWWITLSTSKGKSEDGKMPIDQWLARKEDGSRDGDGLSFSFYPINRGKVWLHDGDYVVVAVKMPKDNVWLLVSINKVTEVHCDGEHPYAEREPVDEYKKWFGRIVFRITDKRALGYHFYLGTYLDRCIVQQILAKPYDGEDFPGYDEVIDKPLGDLQNYLYGKNYGSSWYKELSKYNGVYCLRDAKTHKVYIGSAYGDGGLAQRLECYTDTCTGGDKDFVELYEHKVNAEGEDAAKDYFLKNMHYSIVELMPKNSTDKDVINRESHWKKIFNSRNKDVGSNNN